MKDTAWAAAVTLPAQEYAARTELERIGVGVYMAQVKRTWSPPGATKPMRRSVPLFPRYLLVPLAQARCREVHYARCLRRPKPFLADEAGRIWSVSDAAIQELAAREAAGDFDEVLRSGDHVRLRSGALAVLDILFTTASKGTAELLLPLFGGCRATAASAQLQKAS